MDVLILLLLYNDVSFSFFIFVSEDTFYSGKNVWSSILIMVSLRKLHLVINFSRSKPQIRLTFVNN